MATISAKIRGAGYLQGVPLVAGFMACFVFFIPGAISLLQYDRDRVEAGELWRLLTSHWTHWSLEHLFWDTIVFIILLGWSLRLNPIRTGIMLGASSVAIPLGIYLFQSELVYYRGLSGLDAALFAGVAIHLARTVMKKGSPLEQVLVPLLMAGLGFKIMFEAFTGQAIFVTHMAPDVVVVPLAHIIGAGIGFITGFRMVR